MSLPSPFDLSLAEELLDVVTVGVARRHFGLARGRQWPARGLAVSWPSAGFRVIRCGPPMRSRLAAATAAAAGASAAIAAGEIRRRQC